MRYTLLLHYPEMTAEELGEEALTEGMAAFDAYARPSTTGPLADQAVRPRSPHRAPCWARHGALLKERSSLRTAWLSAYAVTCTGDAPLEWHAHFATRLTPTRRQRRTSFGVL